MTTTLVNLMMTTIEREVEETLNTYADHPYQQAFSIPYLRQELVAYVLCRIPGCYVVLEDHSVVAPQTPASPHEQQAIHTWIQKGIQHVLDRHAEAISHHLPEVDESGRAPSHWFG